jgi:uncharacterized protein (DUF2267 family)/osmotically-inducible protein OsmY
LTAEKRRGKDRSMQLKKTAVRTLGTGAAALGAVAVLGRNTPPGRALRRGIDDLARQVRYAQGRISGLQYRLAGGQPDPNVDDEVLTARIRSCLGPIEKRLDVPRVHVIADERVVFLHGEVPTEADADAIERATNKVPGVFGVESYLHVGLTAASTRPSAGRAMTEAEPSPALQRLLEAARAGGADADGAKPAVRAVLATFAERIPADEREHLLAHLPRDVRELAEPPRRFGARPTRVRTVVQFVGTATAPDGLGAEHSFAITEAVLGRLRELVPDEVADVAAVLPKELRHLWTTAVPG